MTAIDANAFKRATAALVGVAAFALSLAGAHAQSPKIWKHGIVEAKSDAGIVMMVSEKDFAARHGLDIQFMQFKGDALALKALIAGELDSYEGSPGAPIIAAAHGADVKLVGCYWPGLTYALWTKDPKLTLDSLSGKSFAISSPGALPDLFARSLLDSRHVPLSDVTFAAMGSDADRFRAVSAGIVDVAAASIEFEPLAEQMGIRMLAVAMDATPNYLRFCTSMSGKTIASRPDDAANFLAADMEALRYALAHRDETIALARKVTEAKPDDKRAAYVFDEVVKYHAIDPSMPVPMDKLSWMQDLLVRTENLSKPMDLTKLVDPAPREKALTLVKQ